MVTTYYKYDTDVSIALKRDYLQGRLKAQLVAGKQYCVQFYTVLANRFSAYAINNVGAYLDDGSIDTTTRCGEPQTLHYPQVNVSYIITDTGNWTKVEGSFVARGGEKFITLGNFFDARHTDTTRLFLRRAFAGSNDYYSWHLFDDISVIHTDAVAYAGRDTTLPRGGDTIQVGTTEGYLPCYWYRNDTLIDSNKSGFTAHVTRNNRYIMEMNICGNITRDTMVVNVSGTGISGLPERLESVVVYPVPANSQLYIAHGDGLDYVLTDATGRLLQQGSLAGNEIDIHTFSPGSYLLLLTDPETGARITKRVVKE